MHRKCRAAVDKGQGVCGVRRISERGREGDEVGGEAEERQLVGRECVSPARQGVGRKHHQRLRGSRYEVGVAIVGRGAEGAELRAVGFAQGKG